MFSVTVLIGFITAIITFIWFRKSNKTKKREEEEKKRRFRSISSRFPPSQPSVPPEITQTRREKILDDTKRLLNVRRTDFNLFQGNFNQVLSNEEPLKQIISILDTQAEEISQKPTTVNFVLKEIAETPKIIPIETTKETEPTETKACPTTPPNLFTFLKDLSFNCTAPFGGSIDENKGGDEKPLFSSNMFDSGTTTELPSFPLLELPSTTEGYLSINTISTTTTIKAKTPSFSSLPPLSSQSNKKTPYDEQTLLASLVKKKGTNLKNGYRNIFTKQGTINSDDYDNNTLSPTRDEDDDEPYHSIRQDDTDDDIIDDTTDEEIENRQIRRNQSNNDEEIDGYPPIVMVSDESVYLRKHKKESLAITRNLLNETQQFWRSFPPHTKSTDNPLHTENNGNNNNNNNNNSPNNNNNNFNNNNNDNDSKEDSDVLNFEMSLRGNVDYQSHLENKNNNGNNDGYKGIPDPYRHFLSKTDDDVELKKKAYTNIFGSAYDISLHQNVEKNASNNVNNNDSQSIGGSKEENLDLRFSTPQNNVPNNVDMPVPYNNAPFSEIDSRKKENILSPPPYKTTGPQSPVHNTLTQNDENAFSQLTEVDLEQQKINNEKNLKKHKRRASEGKSITNSPRSPHTTSSSDSNKPGTPVTSHLSSASLDTFDINEEEDYSSLNTEKMLKRNEIRKKIKSSEPKLSFDPFDHLLDGVDLHDWNERFQRIMTTIRKFNCNTPIPLQIRANRELIHLAQDFIYASSTYGKIIISEVYCQEKTIKPINIGGKLGGTKYIVQNILFKFAVDESGFYSDYAAAKVGGHELKGLINYFNCNIEDLCLPLMSLVDYRGFRLIAMSILPIRGSQTIIYGSDDYGHTIYNEDPTMETLVKKAGKMMNIKEHKCGMNLKNSRTLWGPADLEGHLGTDNRFYLLDFSRVLPPEAPQKGIQNAHLYRLLRPEHVKLFKKPLCSDAFSSFIALHNYQPDNREVLEATRYLIDVVIPKFAEELTVMMIEEREKGRLESFRLTEAIHSYGINVRYIGVLRKHITELDCRTYLLVEMCSRVVKNKLRKLLRKKMKGLKVPLEEPYRSLVISYLNLVLGDSEASEEYWNNNIKRALKRQFVLGLTENEAKAEYSLKSSLNNFSNDRVDGKLLLFLRLQQMTGLRFTTRVVEEFTQNPNNWAPRGEQPLDETDLEDIGLRVKHMNIISHAQGFVLQMKGAMAWAHDPVAAERFYHMAIKKYEEALDTNPNDAKALIHCAEIAVQFIEGHSRGVAAMKYDWNVPTVQYANSLFRRAVQANPHDSYGLFRYAQFLDKCDLPGLAEDYFLRSLEADPENVACLQEYGNFLTERGNHRMAEYFFIRGSEVAQKYSY